MITYEAKGDVCGSCDHRHRTITAALACADKHHAAIGRHNTRGAYSDRRVRRTDGKPLTDAEREVLAYLERQR